MIKRAELGWGQQNLAFRQFFTTQFIPDGTPEQHQWFNELERITTSPANAGRFMSDLLLHTEPEWSRWMAELRSFLPSAEHRDPAFEVLTPARARADRAHRAGPRQRPDRGSPRFDGENRSQPHHQHLRQARESRIGPGQSFSHATLDSARL